MPRDVDEPRRRVAPREAFELVDCHGWALVDVRTAIEFDAAHPAGARNVPEAVVRDGALAANTDLVEAIARIATKRAKIALLCASGRGTPALVLRLEHAGFAEVVDVVGGFDGARDRFGRRTHVGWRGEGLPIARGSDAGSWIKLARTLGLDPSIA